MTPTLSEEERAFLQRRTARFGLILGCSGLGMLALRVVGMGQVPLQDAEYLPGLAAHLIGATLSFSLFAIHAWGSRSEHIIRSSELVLYGASCVAYGVMVAGAPTVFRTDTTLTLIYGVSLITRSVYVPSDWRWTAALAAVQGVALLAVAYEIHSHPSDLLLAAFAEAGLDLSEPGASTFFVVDIAGWWVILSVVSVSASQVIYGLRRSAEEVRQLGQYTLTRKIGEGGMGIVYEAKHALLRRPTAVKLLHPSRMDAAAIARFEREVRAAAALAHPNTVTVYDYGRTPDGVFYYAMELVDGGTLSDLVAVEGPLQPAHALRLLHQVAGGLAGAHQAGLVHRDMKPDNVLVTWIPGHGEVAKIVDFGLVQKTEGLAEDVAVTQEGAILGTPLYLAPETIRGEPTDARSDLYALGCVAFFLMTGEPVFQAPTVVEVCSKHLIEAPEAPSARRGEPLPDGLDELILALLHKDPASRPATSEDVQAAFAAIEGYGSWSFQDAAAWWDRHGSKLHEPQPSVRSLDTHTIAVDLGRRT